MDKVKVKKKKEFVYTDTSDILSLEKYLEAKSLEGLHFYSFKGFITYTVGDVKNYRYRIEPIDNKRYWPDNEKIDYYEEMGWEFINKWGNIYEIYRCDNPNTPELHSDNISQGYSYENLTKRLKKDMFWNFFGMCLWPILLICIFAFSGTPTKLLVSSVSAVIPFALLSSIPIMKKSITDYKKLKSIKDIFLDGIDERQNHNMTLYPKWKVRFRFIVNMLLILFLTFAIFAPRLPGVNITADWANSNDYPYIPLYHVGETPVEIGGYSNGIEYKYYSNGSKKVSLLAEGIYHFWQAGYAIVDDDSISEYERIYINAETDFYDLRGEYFSLSLAKDLKTESKYYEFEEIYDSRFDVIYRGTYFNSKTRWSNVILIIAKDDKVMSVNLVGDEFCEDIYDKILEIFEREYE